MIRRFLTLVVAIAALNAPAVHAQTMPQPPTQAQVDSLSRAVASYMGPSIAAVINDLGTLDANVDLDIFLETFGKAIRGEETGFTPAEADAFISRFVSERRVQIPDTLSVASQQHFIDSIAALPGARTLDGGVVLVTERAGSGTAPTDTSEVQITYVGRFANGVVFDSTETPISLLASDLVKGFTTGLTAMQPGGKYRLVIPAACAYGPQGIPGRIPGNAALDFTVELIAVSPVPDETPAQ